MAENTEKKPKAAKAKTEETVTEHAPHEARKETKSRWTLEACTKAAKRFRTREEWAKGAPSSFKAAVAHGWEAECSKAFRKEAFDFEMPEKNGQTKKKPKTGRPTAA